MKLSEWARRNGISYKTAWLWWKKGKLPVPAHQTPTGTILVDLPPRDGRAAALYAWVATDERRSELDRQVARLTRFAVERGLKIARVTTEVGSGRDGTRAQLLDLLRTPELDAVVVESREQLPPVGVAYVEAALASCGRRLLVLDDHAPATGAEEGALELLTDLASRLFGPRLAGRRAARALAAMRRLPAAPKAEADALQDGPEG